MTIFATSNGLLGGTYGNETGFGGSSDTGVNTSDPFADVPTYSDYQFSPSFDGFTVDNGGVNNDYTNYFGDSLGGIGDFSSGMSDVAYDYSPGYTPTSSDVGALYGDQGYGEASPSTSGFTGLDFLQKYKDAVSPFQQALRNPIISTLMSLNPVTALASTALKGPTGVGSFLGSLFGSSPIGRMAGAIGGGQLANYATTGEFAPFNGQSIGSMTGGLAGGLSGIPFGGAMGSYLGGQIGGGMNSLQPGSFGGSSFMPGEVGGMPGMGTPQMQATDLNNGLGGLAMAGLGGLYASNQLGKQISGLQGLYGQNSPYATALRQQLERRDAAAGRRSQYGPREVELQAALAGNAAKLAPYTNQLANQRLNMQGATLAALMGNLSRNPNIFSGLKEGWNGLTSLFNSPSQMGSNTPAPEWQGSFNPDNSGFDLTGGGA